MMPSRFCLCGCLLLLHLNTHGQASCELGQPAEGMPEGFAQFAFIIGDFDVQYRQMTTDGWSDPLGQARWNGRYSLDGKAIMDWWYDAQGAGVNIRLYDAENNLWKTAWHYTVNQEVRELHQQVWESDGKLHLWQVYPEAAERNVYFERYEDGRWARIEQQKNPDTGDWMPVAKLEAVPADCEIRH